MGWFSKPKIVNNEKQSEPVTKAITYNQAYAKEDYFEDLYYYTPTAESHNLTLLYLFNNVAEVNSIVAYPAQIASNVTLKHVYIQGNGKHKDVKNSPILKLLETPNPLKGGRSMKMDMYSGFFVFGNVYLNPIKPVGFDYFTKMYQLPSQGVYPIPLYSQDLYGTPTLGVDPRMNELSHYHYFVNSIAKRLNKEDIIHVKDSNLNLVDSEWFLGQSRLYAAIQSCQTLQYLYESINTILSKRGALGFVKQNIRNGEFAALRTDDEVLDFLKRYTNRYGITKGKYPIAGTSLDLSFVKTEVPLSDFIPIELKEDMIKTLCRCMGNIPPQLFGIAEASTYNNVKSMEAQLYTSCVMPIVELFSNELTNYFKLNEVNEAIIPSYDDIEALQEDRKLEAESSKISDEVLLNRYKNDLITKNEMLTAMGLKEQTDGNKYYSETNQGQAEPNQSQQGNGQNNL